MKPIEKSFRERRLMHFDGDMRRTESYSSLAVLLLLLLSCCLDACSSGRPAQPTASTQSTEYHRPVTNVSEAELSRKTPDELAAYIFDHHGCKSCHTLGQNGRLGFTAHGKEIGKNFEGCISMLTAMNVIAQVKDENRTPDEKQKAAKFELYGCTTCHQIVPGKLGLTQYGTKLASMHLACTDVQKILSRR